DATGNGGSQGMFRVRVALVASALLAVATAGGFVYVGSTLSEVLAKRVESEVEHAQKAFLRSYRLEGMELEAAATTLAHEDEFAQVFAKPQDNDRRGAAYVAVEARRARLEKQFNRKWDIIALIDKTGHVVARDLNINSLAGD